MTTEYATFRSANLILFDYMSKFPQDIDVTLYFVILVWVYFEVNLYHYQPNPNWRLLSATTEMHLDNYLDYNFPWIEYTFVLQRHAGMYEAIVGIPALGKKSDHLQNSFI